MRAEYPNLEGVLIISALKDEKKAFRILYAAYHQLHIITYDQLLHRAKESLGLNETEETDEWNDDLPF